MVFFSSRFPGFSRGLLLFSPLVFSQFSPRFRVLVNAEALGPLKKVRKVALRRGWCYSPSGFFWRSFWCSETAAMSVTAVVQTETTSDFI